MRPAPPSNYRPALIERFGLAHLFSHSFRIAVRNLERRPAQVLFTLAGLALATAILIIPSCLRDSINHVMEFQWDTTERQDLKLGLVEPNSQAAEHALWHLPGVMNLEVSRYAFARIEFGQHHRQLAIHGVECATEHERILDAQDHLVPLPPEGMVISLKLAEVLGARLGDRVSVQFLEGRRRRVDVPLVAYSEDFHGLVVQMNRHALNRLMGEGDIITGASFRVDRSLWKKFMYELKKQPRVSWVIVKETLRANFRETTAAMVNLLQSIYMTFAIIVAFGVIYNNVRISLAERARELATLRVVGFSRREVGAVLVSELALVVGMAVPLGLAFGTLLAHAILGSVNTETLRLPMVFTLHNYSFAVMAVVVAATVSTLAVLRRLGQLDLVGALKAPE